MYGLFQQIHNQLLQRFFLYTTLLAKFYQIWITHYRQSKIRDLASALDLKR